jgi:hypothetical protein
MQSIEFFNMENSGGFQKYSVWFSKLSKRVSFCGRNPDFENPNE